MTVIEDHRQRFCIILEPDQGAVREALTTFLARDGHFEIVSEVEAGIQAIATVRSSSVDLVSSRGRIPVGRTYSIRFDDEGTAPRIERVLIELLHEEESPAYQSF